VPSWTLSVGFWISALLVLMLAVIVLIQRRQLANSRQRTAALLQVVEGLQQQLEQGRRVDRRPVAGDDLMTGVANHRAFRDQLRQQWRRTARSKLPLTVMMIDVDGFEAYNGSMGRAAGDECLRQIATALLHQLQRPGDILARFGGDEFAVLLAETDAAGGLAVAERLRETVAALNLTWGGSAASQRITISVGVATTIPIPQEQPESLTAAADRALEMAKRRGRNRVEK
jgi:diguanylate cyclase (GGDEF)-like protein